jgi:hypothetical protein
MNGGGTAKAAWQSMRVTSTQRFIWRSRGMA